MMCLYIAMDQWWKIHRKQSPIADEEAFSLVWMRGARGFMIDCFQAENSLSVI